MSDRIPLTKDVSEDLLSMRLRKGLSQYTLAAKADMTRSKIKRIEKGEAQTISQDDYDSLVLILAGGKGLRKTKRKSKPKSRSNGTGTRASRRGGAPPQDKAIEDAVNRQLRESVLTVMRDVIGDTGRVLVEKHNLHSVTLGELYQVG